MPWRGGLTQDMHDVTKTFPVKCRRVFPCIFLVTFLGWHSALRGRKHFPSEMASIHSTVRSCLVEFEDAKNHSRSQSAEDKFLVDHYFKRRCEGTYIELGGLDGVKYSNSHLFHHGYQWRGLLIEPNPTNFAALKQNRPNDDTYNYAVCSSTSVVHFVGEGSLSATGGILEFMAPSFFERWHPNVDKSALPEIPCKPLSEILDMSSLNTNAVIDFLSLDVEGAEFEVVKTLDFSRHIFGVIFYEADGHDPAKNEAMKTFLEMNGYPFRFAQLRSNFHVNSRWHEIYDL